MAAGDLACPAAARATNAESRARARRLAQPAATLTALRASATCLADPASMHEGYWCSTAEPDVAGTGAHRRWVIPVTPKPRGPRAIAAMPSCSPSWSARRPRAADHGRDETTVPRPRRLLIHAASLPWSTTSPSLLAVFVRRHRDSAARTVRRIVANCLMTGTRSPRAIGGRHLL